MTDLPIDKDKFIELAQAQERQWEEQIKPLWDSLLQQFPVNLDTDE